MPGSAAHGRGRRISSSKAIVGQLNAALAGRQWFHPKDTPWRQMITKKAEENAAQIRPQIHDDEAPARWISASLKWFLQP